jgi:hypothetical protein
MEVLMRGRVLMETEKKVANLRKGFSFLPETEKDAVLTAAKKLLSVQNLGNEVLKQQDRPRCPVGKKGGRV